MVLLEEEAVPEAVPEAQLAETPFDAVVLQRLEEFDLVERLTGRRPGVDAATRRYAKALGLGMREVMEALNPGAQKPQAAPAAEAGAPASSLRERLSARGGS